MSRLRKRNLPKTGGGQDNAAWRRYQSRLKQKRAKRITMRRLPGYLLIFLISLVVVKGGFYLLQALMTRQSPRLADENREQIRLTRSDLHQMLEPAAFVNAKDSKIRIRHKSRDYTFHTSLDPDLQESMIAMMDRRWSRYIAMVVMEPQTGRIVGMASYDRTESMSNPCLNARFPAASLFKIVTAAAALETCGYGPGTRLNFNGGKYTLYRRQLRDTVNRYTNSITLKQAFAESVNPVFGKIGKNCLGKETLEKYAGRFGFSREIESDLPVAPSVVKISDQAYNWAEIACGFNNTTRISPLHAAMLAAAVINNGLMPVPRLVEAVSVDKQVVYRGETEILDRCMTPETARQMRSLMHASVTRGTARDSFRGKIGQQLVADFQIGGKTGSINKNSEQLRYDWFTGYARYKESSEKIAVSVLVVHEKYIGTRAPEYFCRIVHDYFKNRHHATGN